MKEVLFISLISLVWFSCSEDDMTEPIPVIDEQTITIPTSDVDYDVMNNWAFHPDKTSLLPHYNLDISVIDSILQIEEVIPIENNAVVNTGIDVFWVHPTQITSNSSVEVLPIEEQPGTLIGLTIIAQAGLLSKYGRMFAPRYRQSTGVTYQAETDKELQANVIATSYSDVKAAFLNYLDNDNNGNRIILAGHSQGAYLIAMLLRDVFDNDADLRSRLVTAALGGMGAVYASENNLVGGIWENIPLCATSEKCGCIHTWVSFDDSQELPVVNSGLPQFNSFLVNSGLIYRTFNENEDWFLQDLSFYSEGSQSLRYYIAPDANYELGGGNNFIAFDDIYDIRSRRDGAQKVGLSLSHAPKLRDGRPNDLLSELTHPNFDNWGYHRKDYHIYTWALMQQIDSKISNCD